MGIIDKIKRKTDPRNYKIVDSEEYNRTTEDRYKTMDRMNDEFLQSNARPSQPYPYLDTPDGSKIPMWRLSPNRMFEMAENVGDLRSVLETIQREMFRNDIEIKAVYQHKCLVCLEEFDSHPQAKYVPLSQYDNEGDPELKCTVCDNKDPKKWTSPDPKNKQILKALLSNPVNNNRQTLKKVARQIERDLDVIDNAYLLVTRKWKIEELKEPDPITGATSKAVQNIKDSEIDEMIRVNPIQCSIISDDDGKLGVGVDHKPRFVCPRYEHRNMVTSYPVCKIDNCGCECFNAFLETNAIPYATPLTSVKKMFYPGEEVIWIPGKYMPDVLYGNSPLQSIYKKVMSLMYQDEYFWKYFDKERPSKSLLLIGGRNPESARAFMDRQQQGARLDPYLPRTVMLNTDDASKAVSHLDLTPNMKELELYTLRAEQRQLIASVYGIQPLFYGEQAKAGLGNEALQVTTTNRAIKWHQRFLDDNLFSEVVRILGIKDWKMVLNLSEEIDALREEQTRGQEIDNAVKMYGMGFDVSQDGKNKIQVSQFPNPERQLNMMSSGKGTGENIAEGDVDKTSTSKPNKEDQGDFEGQPQIKRPSDEGGVAEGDPRGSGSSLSNK